MLSKNKLKLLRQLSSKKHRDALGLFVAEGPKLVGDLLPYFHCTLLCATSECLMLHPDWRADEVCEVKAEQLAQASQLTTAHGVIAVLQKPEALPPTTAAQLAHTQLTLALDDVQDPGNLGTIIRLADWFGIEQVVCSRHCADAFSPKTVQATMGALARVRIAYTDLPTWLQQLSADTPVYGTFLGGEDLYAAPLTPNGVIVMGNEGNGISGEVAQHVSARLTIPPFPAERATSESLNVALATAIVCAEFRRRA